MRPGDWKILKPNEEKERQEAIEAIREHGERIR